MAFVWTAGGYDAYKPQKSVYTLHVYQGPISTPLTCLNHQDTVKGLFAHAKTSYDSALPMLARLVRRDIKYRAA
jgi:hypothetical protein